MSHPPATDDRRRIGMVSAASLVAANMIGAGVFTTSGFALADLGRPEIVLIAWVVAGALATCGALSYGALARHLPESGGEYHFLRVTVHPLAGFLAGWVSLLAGFTAPIAVAALALQVYLAPVLGDAVREEWIGTSAIILAALMHGVKLHRGVVLQNTAVLVKLVLIAGFVALAAASLPELEGTGGKAPARGFDIGAFAVSIVWISFSYSGWNAAVYIGGEIRDPARNLHRSLLLGTAVVTVAYLALNAVFLWSVPPEELAGKRDVAAIAAGALGGEAVLAAVRGLVALALFTSVSAMVMAGPRVYARMAEDGLFPRVLSERRDAPGPAVTFQAALAVAVVWLSDLRELLGYVGFTLGISAAATVAGLLLERRRLGGERLPIPGHPWVPVVFVLGTLGASGFMALRKPEQAGLGLLTVAAGVPFYWIARRAGRRRR